MSFKQPTSRCAALVLAAGRGRRFGSDKRIARLPSGEMLLATTLGRVLDAFQDVWVVLRPEDDPLALGLDVARIKVVKAERADEGMGASLAAGVRAIAESGPGTEALAVMLGDMPWVEVETLLKLKELAKTERILLPEFEGKQGHPVIFGKTFWGALMALEGDRGGKRVIDGNRQACLVVAIKDHGVIEDLDLPSFAN